MYDHMLRDVQLDRSKIPDRLNTSPHHFIGHGLRDFSGSGDDSNMDTHLWNYVGQSLEG